MVSRVLKNEVCTTLPSSLRMVLKENIALLGILQYIPIGKNLKKNLLARKWRPPLIFQCNELVLFLHI